MSQYRHALEQTFRAFIDFCEAQQLRYFAAYGTALGAVRHHGIIPWDDDIDVAMPRADYDRLLQLSTPEGYRVMSLRDPGYWAPFAKWVNTHTTLWEEKAQPVVIGLYIDIFVLDEAGEEAPQRVLQCQKASRQFRRASTCWTWGDIVQKLLHLHPMGLWRLTLDKLWYAPHLRHYRQQLIDTLEACRQRSLQLEGQGRYWVSYRGPYGQREVWQKSWFLHVTKVAFADFEVAVPSDYDAYLRTLYGNYMQLPPEDKRQTTHSHYYLNLARGMSLDEVRAELAHKE